MTNNPSTDSVIIERQLQAPADLVWKMWTEAEHFKAWYGPTGASIPVATIDATVGGIRHVCMQMQTPDGDMQMWLVGEHLEVTKPVRLVFTESMSDADGTVMNPADMGMPEGHPEVTEVTVELSASESGTTLKLIHAGVPADSPGAMGWNMALDKLEQHLVHAG